MKIPRKLGLSFLAINATAAIVMLVFFLNIQSIERSTARNNISQTIYAKALTLETSMLRQNSQFRGFLVTGDPSYLKSYNEGAKAYDDTAAELEDLLRGDADKLDRLHIANREALAWRRNWGDRLIQWVRDGRREAAEAAVRAAGEKVLVSKVALPLRDLRNVETKEMEANAAQQDRAIHHAVVVLVIGSIALMGLAFTLANVLGRQIARPITALTGVMTDLVAGRNDVDVPATDRYDELGAMAQAVTVFRDTAKAKVAATIERDAAAAKIGDGLRRLAAADLTVRIEGMPDSYLSFADDLNHAAESLSRTVAEVRAGATAILHNTDEISRATQHLSQRTEQQAAAIEQSAAALDEVTRSIHDGAGAAIGASRSMSEAKDEAEQGGTVVREAIAAMQGIDKASKEIAEIIALIDGIAFQTNLLALNAGVEAARAGEAGRGFAVVAQEVRALAQRSANAATEVKQMVNSAAAHIRTGVTRVDETGQALARIIDRVAAVSVAIEAIAQSSDQQARSLAQVNTAIGEMDTMTQENAAMVEQTSAAARQLADKAEALDRSVDSFRIDAAAAVPPPPPAPPSRPVRVLTPTKTEADTPKEPGRPRLVANGDWDTF
ncbi:methyl-accepting chemotaxis protein [Sphingomonas kyungheensis]|uniref:Methyl-accepting chemotaxis protein n=1 Tax=Sphingomonas kyungheensis TaxID=1069987 RepID=A0ABU8H2G7_9SPHN